MKKMRAKEMIAKVVTGTEWKEEKGQRAVREEMQEEE